MVTVTRPRARVLGVALAVGGLVLAGCSPAPDGPPPRDATCPWTAPPRDPIRPASVCRVAGTDLTAGIPRHADPGHHRPLGPRPGPDHQGPDAER